MGREVADMGREVAESCLDGVVIEMVSAYCNRFYATKPELAARRIEAIGYQVGHQLSERYLFSGEMTSSLTFEDLKVVLGELMAAGREIPTGTNTIMIDRTPLQQVCIKLDGPDSYLLWSRSARHILISKGMEGHINGKNPKPIDNKLAEAWQVDDSNIIAWLWSSMNAYILNTVKLMNTAQDIWRALEQTYLQEDNVVLAFDINCQLRNLKQGDMSVNEYVNELKRLWVEFDYYHYFVSENPNEVASHKKYLEKMRIFDFLAGLRPEFDGIRIQTLNRRDNLSLGEVINVVLGEETRIKVISSQLTEQIRSALMVQPQGQQQRSGGYRGDMSKIECNYCHELGHMKVDCVLLQQRKTMGNQPTRGGRGGRGVRGGRGGRGYGGGRYAGRWLDSQAHQATVEPSDLPPISGSSGPVSAALVQHLREFLSKVDIPSDIASFSTVVDPTTSASSSVHQDNYTQSGANDGKDYWGWHNA